MGIVSHFFDFFMNYRQIYMQKGGSGKKNRFFLNTPPYFLGVKTKKERETVREREKESHRLQASSRRQKEIQNVECRIQN
jgi:hypothetical protein